MLVRIQLSVPKIMMLIVQWQYTPQVGTKRCEFESHWKNQKLQDLATCAKVDMYSKKTSLPDD